MRALRLPAFFATFHRMPPAIIHPIGSDNRVTMAADPTIHYGAKSAEFEAVVLIAQADGSASIRGLLDKLPLRRRSTFLTTLGRLQIWDAVRETRPPPGEARYQLTARGRNFHSRVCAAQPGAEAAVQQALEQEWAEHTRMLLLPLRQNLLAGKLLRAIARASQRDPRVGVSFGGHFPAGTYVIPAEQLLAGQPEAAEPGAHYGVRLFAAAQRLQELGFIRTCAIDGAAAVQITPYGKEIAELLG